MVNAVSQIDTWMAKGANALEVDVQFKNNAPKYFFHDTPCDFGRDCLRWAYINNYIRALRDRTIPTRGQFNEKLVLVMFDCKLGSGVDAGMMTSAGENFVDMILIPLYADNPTKMKVIISVPNLTQEKFIRAVVTQVKTNAPSILNKIGFEISWDKADSQEKESRLSKLGVPSGHAWLSSGSTNFSPVMFLEELKAQVTYRDTNGYFSKVYGWTVDKTSTAKAYLSLDLDGIITNFPANVNKAIEEVNDQSQDDKLRLATLDDYPFTTY